jgi:serine/threonine protein kinase
MIGQSISHYRIEEKLGEGGMGVVYKAHDTKLDRTVALKFLPPSATVSEEEKKRFIHEARAASGLDHSNICIIYEIEQTEDGQLFIVMPAYEGDTLSKKIEQVRLRSTKQSILPVRLPRVFRQPMKRELFTGTSRAATSLSHRRIRLRSWISVSPENPT